MADLDLYFTIKDGKRWKEGRFEIDGLMILDADNNYDVTFDDIELYLDKEPYDGSAEAWSGHKYSVEEIFEQVLSGYLKNDGTYTSFSEDWSEFKKLEDLKEYKGDLLIKLPVYDGYEIKVYELDLATLDNTYYSYNDEVMVLDNDNEIITDMENFYMEAITQDISSILKGELECLYMGYNVKEMIKEYGGEDAWLEEFGD